jgi:S1-C subfamily serine protease
MINHKHTPTRMLAVLLIVTAVLANVLGSDTSQATLASRPPSHAASLQQPTLSPTGLEQPSSGGATNLTFRPPLDTDDASELVDQVGSALVDISAQLESGQTSFGTGIVLDSSGLVLTNYHVIAYSDSVRATDLGNSRDYQAFVVGVAPDQDIALIQLRGASRLRTAALGDSDTVRVGDQVVSIGNADGVTGGRPSVGIGPVTRLRQTIDSTTDNDAEPLTGLIEARSHVRPGDSGGAMVNTDGEVIGVTVAYVMSDNKRPTGIGYAIPINEEGHDMPIPSSTRPRPATRHPRSATGRATSGPPRASRRRGGNFSEPSLSRRARRSIPQPHLRTRPPSRQRGPGIGPASSPRPRHLSRRCCPLIRYQRRTDSGLCRVS